jgi:hypothetical protein
MVGVFGSIVFLVLSISAVVLRGILKVFFVSVLLLGFFLNSLAEAGSTSNGLLSFLKLLIVAFFTSVFE